MAIPRRPSVEVILLLLVAIGTISSRITTVSAARGGGYDVRKLPHDVVKQTRRILNLSSMFGTATQAPPYDRVAGHPVYSVTTPWGSPYMTMEKLSDLEEVVQDESGSGSGGSSGSAQQSFSEEQNEYRTVALFFLDPDDALGLHGEMKQMEQLEGADLRLTCFSLAKALRQASNLGGGLLTGVPPNPTDGEFKNDENGNMALRYKIVPPKRQLYYAARCIGKERVGLFGEAADDAQAAVLGNSALEGRNLVRRREKRERKTGPAKRTPMQAANAHMEGYCGIPVFYAPQMQRKLPLPKRLLTGTRFETPMFFNYEDLQDAWEKMRSRNAKVAATMPSQPQDVEVFNLWDLLTSMERDVWRKKQTRGWKDTVIGPFEKRFGRSPIEADLEHITFIPSSRSIQYKESISARGNGKARLRPMR